MPEKSITLSNIRRILVNHPNTIRKGFGNVIPPIAQLKCLYTNKHSMGNKQEELETMMQLDKYDLIAITKIWWDGSHNWNIGTEGYKLFRRDRQGRKGGGVALYIRDGIDCEEFPLRNSHVQELVGEC